MIHFSKRSEIVETLRHEAGHIVSARVLGFQTGPVFLEATRAGAESEIYWSLKSLEETIDAIERRVKVLYSGAIAQTLDNKNRIDEKRVQKLLCSTSSDDFSKIRELLRLLVGLKYPNASAADFQKQLDAQVRIQSNSAAKIVISNGDAIKDFAVHFLKAVDQSLKASNSLDENFSLPKSDVEAFFTARGI